MSKKSLEFIASRLARQDQEGLRRNLRVVNGLIDFSSNDYLGFSRNEELFDLIDAETRRTSRLNGSTGSRLLSGNSEYYGETETFLAGFFHGESALIFNSGYSVNVGVLSSIPQKGDTILYDELAHASLKDGARLSLAKRFSFRHNDLRDLEQKLKRSCGRIYIVVESVYSMDGDESPLLALCDLAEKFDAALILDEAHSTGVEAAGRGLAIRDGCHDRIFARIYTFGKAMGIHGACVVGKKEVQDYLINFSRAFIYTTALPHHCVAAIRIAFEYLARHPELCGQLKSIVNHYKMSLGTAMTSSGSAIQTMIVPGNDQAKAASRYLADNGMDVRPILSPTVGRGSERLRICLHAFNTKDQIDSLCRHLLKIQQSVPTI